MRLRALLAFGAVIGAALIGAAPAVPADRTSPGRQVSGNKPARLEWFRDLGFGMFIHRSVQEPQGCRSTS